jgi:hypothetical protein
MAGLSVGCGKKKSEKSGSDFGFRAGIILVCVGLARLPHHFFRTISAHHDGQRLWVIALPVARRTPICSTALHPNTMGDAPHARLGRNQRWGRVIGGDLPKQIMSIFSSANSPSWRPRRLRLTHSPRRNRPPWRRRRPRQSRSSCRSRLPRQTCLSWQGRQPVAVIGNNRLHQ